MRSQEEIEAKLDEILLQIKKLRGTINTYDKRTESARRNKAALDRLYERQATLCYVLGKRNLDD